MAWSELLPSGKWRGVYRDAAGKRRSAGTHSHKAKADRAAASLEDASRKSSWKDPSASKRTWGDWCDEWWPTRPVEPGTLSRDASRRKVHLDGAWGQVPIGAITRQDVREWHAKLRRKGISPSTAERCVHLLSASLAAAVDAEILPSNPAARLHLAKGAQAQERFLTHEEYDAIQAQMPTTNDQLVMHLLTYTGMRWGEMAGLHWNRVDLARNTLRVAETWDERSSQMKAYPKGRSIREVDLPPWLSVMLAGQERAAMCGQAHAVGKCRSGLVVTTEGGSVLRLSNWAGVWREAVGLSGVGHVRVHDLRHTFCSWLVQDGIPLVEVAKLAGHKSTSTTQKYSHLADRQTSAVMAALGTPKQVNVRESAPRLPHEVLDTEAKPA